MKKILMCLFLCLITTMLFCVDINSSELFDNRLDQTDSNFLTLKARFTKSPIISEYKQTKTMSSLGRNLVSSGKMFLDPGLGIVWLTEKPYSSSMFIGRTTMKQMVGNKTVSMDVSKNRIYLVIADALESVLLGDFSHLEDVFIPYVLYEGDSWFLGLIPKEETIKTFIDSITIQGGAYIEKVLMVENSGDRILYEFYNMEKREMRDEEKKFFDF